MHLENYHQNQKLIEEREKFSWSYFLVESDGKFKSFKTDFFEIYSINDLDLSLFDIDESNPSLCGHIIYPMNQNIAYNLKCSELKKKIEAYKEISNIYLLRIKTASMDGDPSDLTTITASSPPDICNHILSLLGIVKRFYYFKTLNITLSIRLDDESLPKIDLIDQKLVEYDKLLLSLREDQFLLVMNSLRFLNLSKIVSHTDTLYAYSMLCSCIETFSQLYTVEKDFQTHPIGSSLKKEMENAGVSPDQIEQVMSSFGKEYEKRYMYQATKNFQNWCEKMISNVRLKNIQLIQTQETKKLFEKMISNWYRLRSTITHGSIIESNFSRRNTSIIFNEHTKSGNIQKKPSNVNTTVKIQKMTELLPYNDMLNLVTAILTNSIHYLVSKKDDNNDSDIYKRISFFEIGKSIQVTTKVNTLKRFHLARIGVDTYKFYTIMDHYKNLRVLDTIYEKIQQKHFLDAIKLFKNLTNLGEMSDDNLFEKFRKLMADCCSELNDYNPMLDFLEQAEININSSRYRLLNDKAFFLSKVGKHDEALRIIDSVIAKELKNGKDKQNLILFYDTKGDIFHNQTDFQRAKEWWEKSLNLGDSPYTNQTENKIASLE